MRNTRKEFFDISELSHHNTSTLVMRIKKVSRKFEVKESPFDSNFELSLNFNSCHCYRVLRLKSFDSDYSDRCSAPALDLPLMYLRSKTPERAGRKTLRRSSRRRGLLVGGGGGGVVVDAGCYYWLWRGGRWMSSPWPSCWLCLWVVAGVQMLMMMAHC
jgi:hypothetical protein